MNQSAIKVFLRPISSFLSGLRSATLALKSCSLTGRVIFPAERQRFNKQTSIFNTIIRTRQPVSHRFRQKFILFPQKCKSGALCQGKLLRGYYPQQQKNELLRHPQFKLFCHRKALPSMVFVAGGLYYIYNNASPVHAITPYIADRNFIADIVDKAGPAVVFIEIKGSHPVSGKRVTLANGSGFIVRSNGLILTNAHVVANKPKVIVKLHDGSSHDGIVTAVDPVSDLATVKIDTDKKLTVIPLGKSTSIRPGEFVAAMGSPLNLHKTITIGIVSSHLRGSKELGLGNKNMDYIQTDATIGLGNSGGPLVNLEGKAIGINTLKLTEGISFAIPSDYAAQLLEKADLLASKADANKKPNYLPNGKETTKRRYMGITMLSLSGPTILELKEKYPDYPEITHGVYVHTVVVSSSAYAGGLHAGDVIIEINGSKIESTADVYDMVEKSELLRVLVIRGNHKERFTITTETL